MLIEVAFGNEFLVAKITGVFTDFVMYIFLVFFKVLSVFGYMTAHTADALRVHFNLHLCVVDIHTVIV
jgi:hypothetical protein